MTAINNMPGLTYFPRMRSGDFPIAHDSAYQSVSSAECHLRRSTVWYNIFQCASRNQATTEHASIKPVSDLYVGRSRP